jgi:hypothetical protein
MPDRVAIQSDNRSLTQLSFRIGNQITALAQLREPLLARRATRILIFPQVALRFIDRRQEAQAHADAYASRRACGK